MKKLTNKGFTLIEVVLVLAIGGLIFLLAFIAFQQVSTNRRDTQRRSDAGRLVAELQNYKGDKGSLPNATTEFDTFLTSYMGGANFKDPSGTTYTRWTTGSYTGADAKIKYTLGAATGVDSCKAGVALLANEYKVQIALEKGEVCRDSLGTN